MNLLNANDCKTILNPQIMGLSGFGKFGSIPGNEISHEEQKINQEKLDNVLKEKIIVIDTIIDTSCCGVASEQCSIM